MFKKLICFFLLIFTVFFIKAQEIIQPEELETKSFQLYTEKKWAQLSTLVNKALEQKIDYYYIRVRAGIAEFEQKNYIAAELHFRKALTFNSTDEFAQTYLYYCLLNNGLEDEAAQFAKHLSDSSKKIINNVRLNFLVLMEGGTKRSNTNIYNDPISNIEKNYFDPAFYVQLGFKHRLRNNINLFHAYTNYRQTSYLGIVNQNQYYIGANFLFKNQWSVSPAFHFYRIKFTGKKSVFNPNTFLLNEIKDTVYPSFNNYVLAFAINKRIHKFNFSIGTCFNKNQDTEQYIHSAMLSYAVFGNQRLVIGSQFYLNNKNTNTTMYGSILPFIYVQAIPQLSFKTVYFNNKGNNIIEDNGYLVNNSLDLTKERWSVLTNFSFNPRISIYALYQLEEKTESFQGFNYKYHVGIMGIKVGF